MPDSLTQPVTTFEVYMFDNARWLLHARFGRGEREHAVAEARNVEKTLLLPAQVVRDTYHPEENSSDETIVYITDRSLISTLSVKRQAKGESTRRGGGDDERPARGGGGGGGGAAPRRGGRPRQSGKIGGMVTTTLMIVIMSAIGAGAVTSVISLAISKMGSAAESLIGVNNLPTVDMAAFILFFLLFSVPLASKKLHWDSGPARPARAAAPVPARAAPKAALAPKVQASAPEPEKEEEKPEEKEEEEEKKEEKKEEVEVGGDNQKTMLSYLTALLGEVGKSKPQLDAYNRFGVNLMLVGGVEALGARKSVSQDERRGLLSKTMEVMGTKPDTAKSFASKYEDYLNEAKYLGMVRTGYAAMETHLTDNKIAIGNAMDGWNKPQSQQQGQPQIMTVMFTDMVGSTDITQQLGDQGAQAIVRRHNTIVRTTLRQFSGKEIKHTGDGIMCSFPSAADGVAAGIAIQKLIIGGNKNDGTPELHVRIGINAGEPIQEEDDLFGATVQMAARVCAAAGTDQIMVSNVVRELSGGRGINFESKGAVPLKGFKEPQTLYEVRF